MGKELSEMTLEELWELFPIILKEYNSDYKDWYEIEKRSLLSFIEHKAIARINHIGSSAVPGLISKPTIDILLEVIEECDIDQLIDAIQQKGWSLMSSRKNPSLNLSFNKGYTKEGFAEKVYHLHIRYKDDWNELYFRDYLLDHQAVAEEYGDLKRILMDKYKKNRDGYTEAKADFITKYSKLAKEKYGDRYKPVY